MLKGFKDFLLRGNVLDLAVAVVVGAAFTAIVTAFTNNVINPLIAVAGGANDLGWGYQILADNPATFINIGAVITAVINFVIIAAVVYFILIVPANAAKKRFITEPADKKASEADLLIQIRDILESSLETNGATASPDGAHAMTADKAANLEQTRE
ncbi:large conductance mechanosensitive channel protein MscL [Rhodococcus opacus]|uniref:Large-conductance mechanosensitive channel n=2 Tax=Rhodococcus opacus TaxID=37919 RepID=A0AAX3YN11_RHOOP|nr:large conductance mechanosensitive channel protein MscL [Rhodococcus opacus]ELB90838.1 large-conductance mechanosensitive channel [Rhodococcus wratislaviensis IFP 2016]EKT82605.1 large-conductance mechanosensitive channel [Rhodococcus opacus M213]MCZ4582106.1 large conductance mechanosensitive channel protein MscL [Rhodococcus opacus]MDV6247699.1 large conductance mechanosensitive channel protein MscL [Rhodococcus opacus]MDX5963159.1 large conductance mechanosensitive channel protein MscL [